MAPDTRRSTVSRPRAQGLTRSDLLTPQEAADLLCVPRKTILRWAASGYMPGHKLGRRWRFVAAEVEQWLGDDAARAGRAA